MAEEHNVRITAWPKEPVQVAPSELPLAVRMHEPVCVESAYTVSVQIFDRDVATFQLKGRTILRNCREKDTDG
jgi:hypothetical protein